MLLCILVPVGPVYLQSKANLNKVIKKLKGLINLNPEYRYLNHYVRTFEEKYYEANYPGITLEEALLKYRVEV